MSRLPILDGDDDVWGAVINDFLLVAHNADGTLKEIAQNTQTASYTLVASDLGKVIEMNVASANNLTVPANASVSFPIGSVIQIAQYGAGQTTIVAASGVTIRSAGGKMKLATQYSSCSLRKRGTNEWWLVGDLVT